MAELEFTYGATTKTIYPFEARIKRRDAARIYNYHNGGRDVKRLGAEYVIDLKWENLDSDNYDTIVTVLDQIRSNVTVTVSDTDGLNYVDADLTGVRVDIDDDEILEQDFKLFDTMPFELRLISSRVDPWHSSVKDSSWNWGSTDVEFDDLDKPFEEYD